MLAALEYQEMKGHVEVTWITLSTIAHSLMLHARFLEQYINFALMYTFHSIIKSSLLKLLWTLAHLCMGTPLQPLRLDFLLYPRSQYNNCHFYHFLNRTRGRYENLMSTLIPPTCPPPWNRAPNYLPLIHRLGNLHAAPRRAILRRRVPLEECLPCVLRNVSLFSRLVITLILPLRERRGGGGY